MKKINLRKIIFSYIRILIIISIIINIGTILYALLIDNKNINDFIDNELSARIKLILLSVIVFFLTFITDFIEKKENIDIPDMLEVIIVLFIFAGLSLSAQFNLYYKYFWWDDLLHALSGFIASSIGFLLLFMLNQKYSLNFNPILISIFTFSFSLAIGVLWEVLEFTSDVLFGTDHQKWSIDESLILIGKAYQGSGLRDTMSDLIVTCVGALIMSVFFYFLYKYHKLYIARRVSDIVKKNVEIS